MIDRGISVCAFAAPPANASSKLERWENDGQTRDGQDCMSQAGHLLNDRARIRYKYYRNNGRTSIVLFFHSDRGRRALSRYD